MWQVMELFLHYIHTHYTYILGSFISSHRAYTNKQPYNLTKTIKQKLDLIRLLLHLL